ncbi:hypothetical protein U9M48_042004 [Paspalum notatum var. saurae]|uniref:E3 ubiquitin-protein ligase Sina-like RING finger domain-containing protein n=1 Tax=Paspalum notatum var. saurae TaxID=547442 RepID=A0AAQ3UTV6_PASNO
MGRLRAGESLPLREEPRPRFVVGLRKKAAAARASAGVRNKTMGSGSRSDTATPPPERAAAEVVDARVEGTDALECGVCLLPLKAPIFQCNAGHIVCSVCRDKLKATGKCHVCVIATAGYSRALGQVYPLAYGCTVWPVYHDMEDHRLKRPHAPCCCPDKACRFVGSTGSLLYHFSSVSMAGRAPVPCLLASSPCLLFLLNMAHRELGCAISVLGIDPRTAANGQGPFSKVSTECELTYSRYVKSPNRRLTITRDASSEWHSWVSPTGCLALMTTSSLLCQTLVWKRTRRQLRWKAEFSPVSMGLEGGSMDDGSPLVQL